MAGSTLDRSFGVLRDAVRGGANGQVPAERAVGSRAADVAEAIVNEIQQSTALDRLAQTVGAAVGKVLQPGKLKDLASGTWMGHPAHPPLTDVVIGAWTSAMMLDLLGGPAAAEGADKLIGIGVLAALPTVGTGLSELADLGTQHERAVAAAHGIGQTAAVALYATSYLARKSGSRALGVALSTLGAGVMTAAAFLGGHLSFRRAVGVDHTALEWYGDEWTPVLDEGDLAESPVLVNAGGNDVMLYRNGSTICALADHCMHAGGPLHEGTVEAGRVTCPWHGSRFNLADGSLVRGPATAPQPSYETRVEEGKIEVRPRRPSA